jgi:ParB-like chromosome segregation protein Spo0J
MPKRKKPEVEIPAVPLETLTIEYVEPDAIEPNEYNPNRQNEHEFELLCRSMRDDGFTQPIIVGADGKIVDGEHRWRAAREIGLERIPVVRVPMDAAQARIATLRHNRARGSEDAALAAAVLRDLQKLGALDWAVDALMVDEAEVDRMLSDMEPEDLSAVEVDDETIREVHGLRGDGDRADMSPVAADVLRAREKALAQAKSEEEKAAIRKDRAVYRLALTFSAEEAEPVRRVLGDAPAVNLLALCRKHVRPADQPQPA